MSTYITDRSPNKYGGQQNDYIVQSQQIVSEAAGKFEEAVEQKQDLEKMFYETLGCFETHRQKIAIAHQTEEAKKFGTRRDKEKFRPYSFTPLIHPYGEYNKKLLTILQKHLKSLKRDLRNIYQTDLKVNGKSCLERASCLDFSILRFEDRQDWILRTTLELCQKIYKLCGLTPPSNESNESEVSEAFKQFGDNREAMLTLKTKYPELYKKLKISQGIIQMILAGYEQKKSDWVYVTVRLEVDKKLYALSQYLTWVYRDYKEDPIEHMTDHSIIWIVHQDPFLIEPMLKDIAKVFHKALMCEHSNVQEIKKWVALFEYELAHTMPHIRGTAAISEWFEMAIWLYHGYEITYNPKKMVNLEALTSLLAKFCENYDSMIEIKAKK